MDGRFEKVCLRGLIGNVPRTTNCSILRFFCGDVARKWTRPTSTMSMSFRFGSDICNKGGVDEHLYLVAQDMLPPSAFSSPPYEINILTNIT